MGPFHCKTLEQRSAIGRLLLNAEWPFHCIASRVTTAMVADQAVTSSQSRFIQEREEGSGDEGPVNQHDRVPFSSDLVLQLTAFNQSSAHRLLGHF